MDARDQPIPPAFSATLLTMASYFDRQVDEGIVLVYWRLLDDIPQRLFEAASLRAMKTRTFFPRAAELRLDAEACRLELRAQHPYVPCRMCVQSTSPGWITVIDPDDVKRLMRCECWTAWQVALRDLGCAVPLALPPANDEIEVRA